MPVVDPTPAPPPAPPAPPEAFTALDKMVEAEPPVEKFVEKAPEKPVEKAPAKNVAPVKAPAKAVAKVEIPPTEVPKGKEAAVKILEEVPPNSPAWFRTHYEKAKNEIKTLRADLEKVATKPVVIVEDTEKNQIRETLTQREKKLAELEGEIRYVDYTKSEEYKNKYHDPYVATWQNAVAEVSQLTVKNADGSERSATADDFEKLMAIGNPNEALRAAGELFGDPAKAAFVMTQAGTVKQSIRTAQAAIQDFRTQGAERAKKQQEQFERTSKETTAKWRQLNEQTVSDNPEIYQPEDGDEEGNEILAKGFERADAAFGGHITDEHGNKRPPTPQEMIEINSALRNKAAAFDRVVHRLTKQQARVAELESQIAEYEKSGPGSGVPLPGGERAKEEDSFEAAIDRIAG